MSEIKNDLRSVAIVMFPDGNYLFLTPAGNIPDFKDAIDEKICKIKGILNCIIFAL